MNYLDFTSGMGIDPGFGSSKFAITVLMLEDNIIKSNLCND
jgi:hypothetical protein